MTHNPRLTPRERLAACPFCGSTEESPIESVVQLAETEIDYPDGLEGNTRWTVQCDGCTGTFGMFDDPDKAVEHWNTRAIEASEAALLAEVRAVVEPFARAYPTFGSVGPDGIDDGLTIEAQLVADPQRRTLLGSQDFAAAATLLASLPTGDANHG